MKTTYYLLSYFLTGIALGIGCLSYYVPHDRRLLSLIEYQTQKYIAQSNKLNVTFRIEKIDILRLKIVLKDIKLTHAEVSTWLLSVGSLEVGLCPESSLEHKKLVFECSVHELFVRSEIKNNIPTIVEHCAQYTLNTTNQWYSINKISVLNAIYRFDHLQTQSYVKGIFDTTLQMPNDLLKLNFSYQCGECVYHQKEYIKNIQGTAELRCDLSSMKYETSLKGSFDIASAPLLVRNYHYQARYLNGQGILTISTPYVGICLQAAPIIVGPQSFSAQITSFVFLDRLSYISSLLQLGGIIKTQAYVLIRPDQWSIKGSTILKDFTIAKKDSYDAAVSFNFNNNDIQAHCLYKKKNNRPYSYQLQGDPSKRLLKISSPESAMYNVVLMTNDWLLPESLLIFQKNKKLSLAKIDFCSPPIKTTLNYQLIRPFLEHYTGLRLLGNSILNIILKPSESSCEVALSTQGNIYFPMIYNFICSVQAKMKCLYASQTLELSKLSMFLEKGMITIKDAYLTWKDKKEPAIIHIPISFSDIFINQARHAYAWLSGNLVIEKNQVTTSIKGDITIDKSSFYANPFSRAFRTIIHSFSERSYNVPSIESDLGIQLRTVQPIIIKTSIIKALVDAHISINGTTTSPIISGVLSIRQGELLFGYKPLSLINGHITLLPHQHNDPLIEFIARGTVRRYQVTIHCQGSINHPQLYLSSTPSLNQEQIVTLLMTGSPEGNLGLLMPSLIINNLQTILFDEQEQSSKTQYYVNTLLSPLRYVKFVPNFADQSARGGFRGSIEVDVGSNLRATIKKNFSLLEDTKIEVEYTASDDVTVRALKDERGDLGGEIEMRFKF